MGRDLDSTLAAALPAGNISPAFLAQLTFRSGVAYVWSGVGDLVHGGHTYKGVGSLASVGAITEGVAVQAEGTTVTLNGIGQSFLPGPVFGLAPPFTIPAGSSFFWALPQVVGSVQPGPGSGGAGGTIATLSHPARGGASMTGSAPLVSWFSSVTWGDFSLLTRGLPPGAVITGIYPVIKCRAIHDQAIQSISYGAGLDGRFVAGTDFPPPAGSPGTSFAMQQITGPSIGTALSDLVGMGIQAQLMQSARILLMADSITVAAVAFAVVFTTPEPDLTMTYEAMSDMRIGGPAKIWFGLMADGAFLGDPYLVFSGQVDKPTVNTSPDASSITLALENRLVNLQRPDNRKYTAADQHLDYPDDMGFDWVEILQEISLKEGS